MSSHAVTLLGYGLGVLAGLGLEIAARRPGSRIWTMDGLVRRVLATPSGRIGLFAFWAWLGLHFLG